MSTEGKLTQSTPSFLQKLPGVFLVGEKGKETPSMTENKIHILHNGNCQAWGVEAMGRCWSKGINSVIR